MVLREAVVVEVQAGLGLQVERGDDTRAPRGERCDPPNQGTAVRPQESSG
jgi:hypothetical protein